MTWVKEVECPVCHTVHYKSFADGQVGAVRCGFYGCEGAIQVPVRSLRLDVGYDQEEIFSDAGQYVRYADIERYLPQELRKS